MIVRWIVRLLAVGLLLAAAVAALCGTLVYQDVSAERAAQARLEAAHAHAALLHREGAPEEAKEAAARELQRAFRAYMAARRQSGTARLERWWAELGVTVPPAGPAADSPAAGNPSAGPGRD